MGVEIESAYREVRYVEKITNLFSPSILMGVVHIRNVKLLYESQKNLVSSLLKASFVLGNCDKSISTPFMSVSLRQVLQFLKDAVD